MRTTVDIPDPIYRRLKSTAALRGCSVKELVLQAIQAEFQKAEPSRKKKFVKLPIITSKNPGWLNITNREINEILFP